MDLNEGKLVFYFRPYETNSGLFKNNQQQYAVLFDAIIFLSP
jgi:hypothetical protein